ncbi:MAG: mannose-1-phosphate guanylyltransferase/mannose-6-phosphate isomerase [Candidatus Moranbacteria bacterium]|nr:mannose-1-phosphate guanylyltransferase/mannose-6-phosphate isomerase [Candidatus Moranbacteria bacterium]
MYSVILCGGSGTRLWPLSRKNYPKQFLNLYSDHSLIQETFLRISKIIPKKNIYFISNQESYFNVLNQIREIYPELSEDQIITEPTGLNTAPAIAYAMRYLKEKVKIRKDKQVIFLPSDHYIGNEKEYVKVIKSAMKENKDYIGTIGITPTAPETGYGYIQKSRKKVSHFRVVEFKEKPNKKTAEKYIKSGKYVWNGGMYIFNFQTFEKELKKHSPEIYEYFKENLETFTEKFNELPSISIDYAISEKSKKVIVFEGDFGWSDIGSFDALADLMIQNGKDENPKHIKINSKNTFIHSKTGKLITVTGVDNLIVVESNDSILIQKRGESEKVKDVVEHLKDNGHKEINDNMIVHRPWGKYEVLIDEDKNKVKKITVYPGKILSLQMHYHRAEHWVVIKGTAEVVNGDKTIILSKDEGTFIPKLTRHRLANPGKIDLEIIEVQSGSYLEEDDIIRFDDEYGRVEKK